MSALIKEGLNRKFKMSLDRIINIPPKNKTIRKSQIVVTLSNSLYYMIITYPIR